MSLCFYDRDYTGDNRVTQTDKNNHLNSQRKLDMTTAEKLLQADGAAWDLYLSYLAPRLGSVFARLTDDPEEQEEAYQDAIVAIVASLGKLVMAGDSMPQPGQVPLDIPPG